MTLTKAIAELRHIAQSAVPGEAVFSDRTLVDLADFMDRYPRSRSAKVLSELLAGPKPIGEVPHPAPDSDEELVERLYHGGVSGFVRDQHPGGNSGGNR